MAATGPQHPTKEPDSIDRPEPRRATRNIPPLVWVIVAVLLIWLVIAVYQRANTHVTPQGGTMPQAGQESSYMPAAPATGDAPATPPSSTVETN